MNRIAKPAALVIALTIGPGSPSIAQDWNEDFESYSDGQVLYNVNGWSGWDNVQQVAGSCTTQLAHGGNKSILIEPNDDAIRTFEAGYNAGQGTMRAWMYLPFSQHTADTFYIVQNEYAHGGPYQWCIEYQFDITTRNVLDDFRNESGVVNIIYDQWVELRFEIDIETDSITCYYNNQEVSTGQLFIRGGDPQIKNIDLYSTGSTNYFDDLAITGLHNYELLPWPFLQIEGTCPGLMTFQVSHATPGEMVAFIYGFQEGTFRIPNGRPCIGTELGIRNPAVAGTARADQNGVAALNANVPLQGCGRVFIQALDISTCAVSGVELVCDSQGNCLRCEFSIECRLVNDTGDCAGPVRRLVRDLDALDRVVYHVVCRPPPREIRCPNAPRYMQMPVRYRIDGGEPQFCVMDVKLNPLNGCVRPTPSPF
ncbi:MAG: hypothetical protein ACREA0_16575, partial [bacterium]